MFARVLILASLAGLWLLPALSWVTVLDSELSGFEVVPLAGLLPWLFLLFLFIARYVKRPVIVSVVGSGTLVLISLWLLLLDVSSLTTVLEFYESKTGLMNAADTTAVKDTGMHFVYAAVLGLAAGALVLGSKRARSKGASTLENHEDSRLLWEEQQ